MSEINGIPVVNQAFVEDRGYSVPFITSIDGDLFLLQIMRNRGDDGYKPYYVRIGSVLKEYLKASAKEEPTEKDCKYCEFSEVGADEEPCVGCWDHNSFQSLSFKFREPKASQDTVNLKLRDIDGNLHEVEVPVKEKTCQHNEFEPLTFKDIEIGDELESIVDSAIYVPTVIIVTHNCSDRIYGFRKNTGAYVQLGTSDLPNWRKTGVTYPEIAKIIGGGV